MACRQRASVGVQDKHLLHGEALLVLPAGDLEHVALELLRMQTAKCALNRKTLAKHAKRTAVR